MDGREIIVPNHAALLSKKSGVEQQEEYLKQLIKNFVMHSGVTFNTFLWLAAERLNMLDELVKELKTLRDEYKASLNN